MFELISLWLGTLIRAFCTRGDLMLENLALRQQLAVLKRKHPRASLRPLDKLFWVVARRFWSRWKEMLVLVQHQQPTLEALQSFLKEIAVASPKTKVIVPKYFQPIPLEK